MTEKTLGSDIAIKMAMYYVFIQFMFILLCCVSWQYHLMVYHVSFSHADITKMMPLRRIWDIYTQITPPTIGVLASNSSDLSASNLDKKKQLDDLLSKSKNLHATPIHVYKGLFDADIMLSPTIQTFVTDSIKEAFPWGLQIDSVDLLAILYAFSVVCFYFLYSKTVMDIAEGEEISHDSMVTADLINTTLMLTDALFWVILLLLVFILLELSSAISIISLNMLCSLDYTLLLYMACAAPFYSVEIMKPLTLAMWGVHAFLLLVVTDASMLDGSCLIFINFALGIFYYINVVEKGMTIIKFLNLRLWTIIFLNICFIVVYTNNIICIDVPDT